MLSFKEFQYYIEDHILDGWKEEADVKIQKAKKNNGVTYCGLYIKETEESVAPSIYLEEFYERYMKGENMDEIIEQIRKEYKWAMERAQVYQLNVEDYAQMKDWIIYRLVNYKKNKELLQDAPFIRLYDLAITFRWIAHTDDVGISSALITNQELLFWGISIHELLLVAQKNTQRIFPPYIVNLDRLLAQAGEIPKDFAGPKEMFVMTNQQQINGATVLVYEGVLKEFAETIQDDLYILPSSIHELILVPATDFPEPERMLEMVKEANEQIVAPIDILSDSVYYYNRKKNQMLPVKSKASL